MRTSAVRVRPDRTAREGRDLLGELVALVEEFVRVAAGGQR
jgi:hypothetical protein